MKKNKARRFANARVCVTTVFVGAVFLLLAQDGERASHIYTDSSKSVFLLIAKSEKGEAVGQGTGFLIAGGKIVTNEHVARAGASVSIDLGAVKIPVVVERVDAFNDLALLSTSAELSAKPLVISDKLPNPGASVFAIGNPAGLERSISTGVVSGIRQFEGRQLIQVTTPISLGSSGGPILDTRGEVVGVAVGMLQSGQNLNFAVPASLVQKLLRGEVSIGSDVLSLMERVDTLGQRRAQFNYSAEPDSDWQKTDREVDVILLSAMEKAGNDQKLLLRIGEKAEFQNFDIAIAAAERAVRVRSTFESNFALGKYARSKAAYAKEPEKSVLLAQSEKALRAANQLGKAPTCDLYYDLADVLEDRGSYAEADTFFRRALDLSNSAGDSEQKAQSLRSLTRTSHRLGQSTQTEVWFKTLVSLGKATALDWQGEGQRLYLASRFRDAGQSYIEAGNAGGLWTTWCEAATSFALSGGEEDTLLFAARKCVSEGTGQKDSEGRLANAHYLIANTLNGRGVYQEGLSHAKEASVLNPSYAWAFNAQAEALEGLRRFQEAINASIQAIRLSDGKYALMHFNLGSAYFDVENWEFARQSFEKAAQLEPKDSGAAYNVALCYAKLGYYRDAATWYEEVLRRNPDHPKKQDILNSIRNLRQ